MRQVRETAGRYTRRRHALAWFWHLAFLVPPWLRWHGAALVRYAAAGRLLVLGGHVFSLPAPGVMWPLLAGLALLIVLAPAALVGRLWCGYACPHTAHAALFLWIERRIEGLHAARLRLDAAPRSLRKGVRRLLKHGLWLMLSLWCGFTLAAWATPAPRLLQLLAQGRAGTGTLAAMGSYAALAYVNAGLRREWMCRHFCPLGPLQRAMRNRRTLVVTYDAARGEPRGLRNAKRVARAPAAAPGDCVDCTLCLQVCPTGQDIRAAGGLDCLGCGACIEACDAVMDRRGLPRGLIRYARPR